MLIMPFSVICVYGIACGCLAAYNFVSFVAKHCFTFAGRFKLAAAADLHDFCLLTSVSSKIETEYASAKSRIANAQESKVGEGTLTPR